MDPTGNKRFWSVVVILALVVTATTLFLWRRDAALIKTVRQETVELKAALEARDISVSEMQTKLAESLQQLAIQQNAIQTLGQYLAAMASTPEPPEQTQQERQEPPGQTQEQRQLYVAALEGQLTKHEEKLETAKQKVEQLAKALNVPDEVSKMEKFDLSEYPALEKQYAPYLAARVERNEFQHAIEEINTMLIAAKGGSQ